jgi:hypothetical protein
MCGLLRFVTQRFAAYMLKSGGMDTMPTILLKPENTIDQDTLLSSTGVTGGVGFCLSFAIQWAIECQRGDEGSPESRLQEMKAKGPFYFKQLVQSQKAYETQFNDLTNTYDAVGESLVIDRVMSLMSGGRCSVIPFEEYARTPEQLAGQILSHSGTPPVRCQSSVVLIRNHRLPGNAAFMGNHAIAITVERRGGNVGEWALLDPGGGLFQSPLHELTDLIGAVWGHYKPEGAAALMVI